MNTLPMSTGSLLTTSRVARILDVAEGTVRNLERRGVLPVVRTESGIRLFDAASVELERARRAPAPLQRLTP